VKRELERIEIPGEHEARVRTWDVVRTAYAEREPEPRRVRFVRPVLAAGVVAALVAAALSPPGRAVVDSVRKAIGVESAEEALFSLPAPGRLLVTSDAGVWVIADDGTKRLLGDYREASWSPFGRFIVAARDNELATLEPDGDVHWKLARPDVRLPRWGGTRTDTRIAYASRRSLRVVAGDGTGDHVLALRDPFEVAGAWRPDKDHTLAFATNDGVFVFDADNGNAFWGTNDVHARSLVWSADGTRLLALTGEGYVVFAPGGRVLERRSLSVRDASFAPTGHALALLRRVGGRSELLVDGRRRFSGTGTFEQVFWSPNGRWLLVSWREPDQWLLVSARGPRRLHGVANISRQFDSRTLPTIEGWGPPAPDEP
jgi:hypothetical protein